MKRRELIKRIIGAGFVFERNGGNHDIYVRGNEQIVIPRHKEINERLALAIIKNLN